MLLHTKGTEDADIYVQKGISYPDTTNFYLASVNYKSDEIFIPRSKRFEDKDKSFWYTIGVHGISKHCSYSLTAISNSYKVINYELGQIVSTEVSQTSPLVLRLNGEIAEAATKIFFYSFDSQIKAMVTLESEDGVLKSIPNYEGKQALQTEFNNLVGNARQLRIRSPPVPKDPWVTKLLTFYPTSLSGGVVNVVAYHPEAQISLTPGGTPLLIRLAMNESVTCAVTTDSGQLDQTEILITSTAEKYDVVYDQR